MNYFALYQLQPSLVIDEQHLESIFYSLCKQYHPDMQNQLDNELTTIAEINIAYEVLKNEEKRIEYILNYFGFLIPQEKEKLDNVFLLQTLEWNEVILDAKNSQNIGVLNQLKIEMLEYKKKLKSEVEPIFILQAITAEHKKELEALAAFYKKTKYLNRILDQLNT